MSQSNKPAGENKPQPTTQEKPASKPAPAPRDFSMGRVIIGDSADNITRKNKP